MQRYNGVAQDRAGNAISNVSVSVFSGGTTTLASIFSDNGVTALVNPFTGNVDGTYDFYAANGRYDITVTRSGFTFPASETADELLNDPATVAVGAYGSVGLVAQNNVTTPNTKFDIVADVAVVRVPSTGAVFSKSNTGTITNDTGLAGSIVNGRDQAAAFGASNWIHFYWIYNGTTFGTLSSLTAPPTGPTLPSGYTYWGYVGAVRYDSNPFLVKTRIRGSWAYYESQQAALATGTATVETAVSVSTLIPPNALQYTQQVLLDVQLNSIGKASSTIRIVTGVAFFVQTVSVEVSTQTVEDSVSLIMPNIGQQFFYLLSGIAPSAGGLFTWVGGYQVPNGGA